MVKKIVNVIINNLWISANYSQEQKAYIEYSLNVIIHKLIKLISIVLILYMLRLLKEGLIVLLTIITKSFIDGYHEDSEIKCFFATMTIIGNLIILVSSIRLYKKN